MLNIFLLPILFLTYLGNVSEESTTLASESPVLIELFTSQGCSSCPPADRVIADFVKDPDLNVVALSFHVDYWNRLGWKDPYSQTIFTQRQYKYAEKLTSSRRVYTPQIVVNGQSGHVGSRRKEVRASILKAAKSQKTADFDVVILQTEAKYLDLQIDVSKVSNDYELVVCLVDAQVNNEVSRGENRGRDLAHVQVVRSMKKVSTGNAQKLVLDLSTLDQPDTAKIVAFLQHKKSWKVTGVKEYALQ